MRYDVAYVNLPSCYYRIHGASITKSHDIDKWLAVHSEILSEVFQNVEVRKRYGSSVGSIRASLMLRAAELAYISNQSSRTRDLCIQALRESRLSYRDIRIVRSVLVLIGKSMIPLSVRLKASRRV